MLNPFVFYKPFGLETDVHLGKDFILAGTPLAAIMKVLHYPVNRTKMITLPIRSLAGIDRSNRYSIDYELFLLPARALNSANMRMALNRTTKNIRASRISRANR